MMMNISTSFGNIWGEKIYITGIDTGIDTGIPQQIQTEYPILISCFHNNQFITACSICENCKVIINTLIYTGDNKYLCPKCKGENILYISNEMSVKYRDKINTKVSDAEFLTFLLQEI